LETFLQNLCTQKMGLSAECYKDPKAEIFTYTTDAFYEN
jgi:AMMECR1 domain-containing protein